MSWPARSRCHYLSAHENAPEGPEADALAAQARIALKAAAERATALGVHAQAASYLRQALKITTDPADEAALLEQAGMAASHRRAPPGGRYAAGAGGEAEPGGR